MLWHYSDASGGRCKMLDLTLKHNFDFLTLSWFRILKVIKGFTIREQRQRKLAQLFNVAHRHQT